MNGLETLRAWVGESQCIVFFGGAGVSTESGIPDFRGVGGLYRQKYANPPETMLHIDFFRKNPEEFFRFYRDKILITNAQPNAAHEKLAEWEQTGKLLAIVTQNIDGLHQKAGNGRVFELHGSIYRNRCMRCGQKYGIEVFYQQSIVPFCACGGIVRPEVVMYGEHLDSMVFRGAINAITQADLLIVGGTSLVVYPAAGLIDCYHKERLVLINKTDTGKESRANLVFHEPIGELFSLL